MRVFTIEQAEKELGLLLPLKEHLNYLATRSGQRSAIVPLIPDSGKKAATAKLLSNILLLEGACVVFISGWSIWESSEILELFYSYRKAKHEERLLTEAPIHFFTIEEAEELASIIAIVLFFIWDATIFTHNGNALITIDHDEYMSIASRSEGTFTKLVSNLERYGYHCKYHDTLSI